MRLQEVTTVGFGRPLLCVVEKSVRITEVGVGDARFGDDGGGGLLASQPQLTPLRKFGERWERRDGNVGIRIVLSLSGGLQVELLDQKY